MKKNGKYIGIGIVVIILITIIVLICVKNINNKKEENLDSELSTEVLPWVIYRKTDGYEKQQSSYSKMVLENYDGLSYKRSTTRELFLTFDVGYASGLEEEILDIVGECDIKVSFFITKAFLRSNPELVKRMIDDGHVVGNHTANHYDLTKLSEEEIKDELLGVHDEVKEKFGYEMHYFRPPEGLFSEKVLDVAKSLGYRAVLWGFAYDDWDEKKQKGEEYAKNMIFNNVRNGEVILLHANSKDNLAVLKEFITTFQDEGYEFKTVEEY